MSGEVGKGVLAVSDSVHIIDILEPDLDDSI